MSRSLPIIGVSSCLLGQAVRYDGNHKQNQTVLNLLQQNFSYRSFCPETEIGLGVPREAIQLVSNRSGIICIGTKTEALDVTQPLRGIADQQSWGQLLSGYIFKARSPSCGVDDVPIFHPTKKLANGRGLFTKRFLELFPDLPIADEQQLDNSEFRQNFIAQVQTYHLLKQ